MEVSGEIAALNGSSVEECWRRRARETGIASRYILEKELPQKVSDGLEADIEKTRN